jgi:hypothetical protein
MWSNKKPETPQAADPEPKNVQMNQPPKPAPTSWEGTTKMSKDAMRPTGATADRATARLGSSLRLKGEISGNEDLHIDGTVEGTVRGADRDARRQVTEGTSCFAALCRTTTARLRIVERSRRLACPNMST